MDFRGLWGQRDHRVDQFPLISFPKVFVLFCLYLIAVYFGPKLMKSRSAFSIKWIVLIYNVFIILLNFYIAVKIIFASFILNYNWICEPIHYDSNTENPEDRKMVEALYLYFLTKPIEWLDTIFAIIRKKPNQTSFLHIYHHSTVFLVSWAMLRYTPSGHSFFSPLLNSIVHVVMYSYYFLAAFGPKFQKYLWWKRYLTKMQLIQFALIITHAIFGVSWNCGFPRGMTYFLELIYPASLIILFADFYQKTYKAKPKLDNYENNRMDHALLLNKVADNALHQRNVTKFSISQ